MNIATKAGVTVALCLLWVSPAQARNPQVEGLRVKSALTGTSKKSPDKAWLYSTYSLDLKKGDTIAIDLSAEFSPHLNLVTPGKKKSQQTLLKQKSKRHRNIKHRMVVKRDGPHGFIVMGDAKTPGRFWLTINYMNRDAKRLPRGASVCEALAFIGQHRKARFFFIRGKKVGSQEFLPTAFFRNIKGCRLLGGWPLEFYHVPIYEGNDKARANKLYNQFQAKIDRCVGSSWKVKKEGLGLYKSILGKKLRLQRTRWTEKKKSKPMYLFLVYQDDTPLGGQEGHLQRDPEDRPGILSG